MYGRKINAMVKMFNLGYKTCNRTCLRAKYGLKTRPGGILLHSALVGSLAPNQFSEDFPRTCFLENTSKGTFSTSVTIQERAGWFGRRTTIGFNSAENFHRNIANFRIVELHTSSQEKIPGKNSKKIGEWRENKIFTVPNILCFGRILASPVLGYFVLSEHHSAALFLFMVAGFTDMLDGFIARRFPSQMSYLGSVLDPIADKILVGVLTVSLSLAHLIPVPLAVIILGRDIGLILASFVVRFISLPPPRTFSRFFDFQLPTVQVTPSVIGKVNTALQVGLISLSLAAPILEITEHLGLLALQCTVGITTIVSGLDYFVRREGFSILEENK